jgi:deoxyribose-phosphate aldolase
MTVTNKNHGLTVETLARLVDHTLLAPDHTIEDVERACREAVQFGFHTVSVAPYDVARAAKRLHGTAVLAGGTVGIPFGHSGLEVKREEAAVCIEAGAGEVDMVLNLIAMKSGRYGDVKAEIAAVRKVTTGCCRSVPMFICGGSQMENCSPISWNFGTTLPPASRRNWTSFDCSGGSNGLGGTRRRK